MANGVIDNLDIEVSASSEGIVQKLNDIADALSRVKTAASGNKFSGLKQAIRPVRGANIFKDMTADQVAAMSKADLVKAKMDALKASLNEKMAAGVIDDKGIADAVSQIQKLTEQYNKLARNKRKAAEANGELKTAVEGGTLEVLSSSASEANENLKKTISRMGELKKLVKSEFMSKVTNITGGLGGLGGIALAAVSKALTGIVSLLKSAVSFVWNIAKGIAKWTFNTALKSLKAVMNVAKKIPAMFGRMIGVNQVADSIKQIRKLLSGLGRVAFYRAIRSAIKMVTDALKEGSDNAYFYAKQYGEATRYIAEAMDALRSGHFKVSNQLGAAWNTLLAAVEPILQRIIALVTAAAEAMTRLFALFGGKGSYLKAKDYTHNWADETAKGAAAAKEWKNQLMGFDEINRLEEPSGGSGGAGDLYKDYQNMFEEAELAGDFYEQIRKAIEDGDWAGLGKLLGQKFNEIINGVGWSGWGKKIGGKIGAAITTSYHFLKTADFQNLGRRIAEFLDNMGDQINFNTLGRLMTRIRTALWDVLYGAFTNPGSMARLAGNLSDYVLGALNELSDWLETLSPQKIATALSDFIGNIKYSDIKDAFVEVVQKAWKLVIDTKDLFLQSETGQKLTEKLKEIFGDETGSITWESVAKVIRDRLKDAWDTVSKKFDEIWPKDQRDAFMQGVVNAFDKAFTEWLPKLHNVLMYELDKAVFGENWAAWHWSKGDYAGKELILGLIHGEDSQTPELKRSTNSFIGEPVTDVLAGIESAADSTGQNVSKEMSGMAASVGSDMSSVSSAVSDTAGAFNDLTWDAEWGMSDLAGSVAGNSWTIMDGLYGIAQAAADAWGWLKSLFQLSDNGSYTYDLPNGNKVSYNPNKGGVFAGGGFPEDGMFFANHGELVGRFSNGRTAVANNEQITAGIADAVYGAFMSAFSQTGGSGGSNQPVNIYLDGRQIAQTTTKYQNQFARASGI